MMLLAANQLQVPDYIVLVGYFALMLGIGAYFYRHMRGMKDYFSGSNSIPWWLSGVSFYMSSFSAFAFISYSALAFQYGWVGVTLYWVTVPAALFSVVAFAKRWRRARIDSPVEYLETRYNNAFRQLVALQGIPVKMVDDGLKLLAIGMVISVSLGLPMADSMIGAGVIILLYTFMGGLWAVTVTDFIQFVVMSLAVIIILPLSIVKVGGIESFIANSPEGYFHLVTDKFNWVYIVLLAILYCVHWSSINWPLIQRYYCVPKESDALKVGWLVVALNVVTPPMMFLPAMAASQFIAYEPPAKTSAADASLTAQTPIAKSGKELTAAQTLPSTSSKVVTISDTNRIYPTLCLVLLPAGMIGLVLAAMFSATMSMLSSDYNVCANVLTNDVYRRLLRPNASDKELVLVGRLATLFIGCTALGVAFLVAGDSSKDDNLFRNMVSLFSIVTAPVGIPMILGLLSRRLANSRSAFVGLLLGIFVGALLFLNLPEESTFLGIIWLSETIVFAGAGLTTLVAMTIVGLLFPMLPEEAKRVDAFQQRLNTPIGELEEDRKPAGSGTTAMSPFLVVGISLMFIGVLLLSIQYWIIGWLPQVLNLGLSLAMVAIGIAMALLSGGKNKTSQS